MSALGAQNSAYGQGLQGQYGARSTAYGGDMASAGTIGQGDIAAANARAAGSQNIFNGAMKLGGLAFGAATGGLGGIGPTGASTFGSLLSQSGSNPFNPDGSRNTWAYGRGE